jgi:hypothetical protein
LAPVVYSDTVMSSVRPPGARKRSAALDNNNRFG